jgi:cyclophilin family peptidyl-prolyl cis-trans isomerase
MSKKRTHTKGAVAIAHAGDPAKADSQIYVTLDERPDLDGRYTVFGRVVAGADVPARIERGDLITRMYVRE